MKTFRIAAIPGDGIGTEVVSAGVEVLHTLAKREGSFQFKVDHFDWGGEYYKKHGRMMPENGRSLIRNHDAILFGSAGHPDIPDHITLWGLRLAICQPFDQYANVRPTRVLPGITSPLRSVKHSELDWVIVRENSEGEYAGVGGRGHHAGHAEMILGLLYKAKKKRELAVQHLIKAKEILSPFGQTPMLARLDTALAEVRQ
jgi:tartrate dehydrogenase/decarboxylase/D-malate dehydrogenase